MGVTGRNCEGMDGEFTHALSASATPRRCGNYLARPLYADFRGVARVCQDATAQSRP